MDFALERKFLDSYHSGRDEVDNIEDSRAKEENTGAKYLHSYLGMENAVIMWMSCVNEIVSIVITEIHLRQSYFMLRGKICLGFCFQQCIIDTVIVKSLSQNSLMHRQEKRISGINFWHICLECNLGIFFPPGGTLKRE